MVMKWDAAAGRYVNVQQPANKQGVDTLPKGVSPYSYGAHYVDAVTGEDKIIVAGSKPDKVVVKDPKTGAWVNKGTANAAGSAYAPNTSKTTGGTNTGAPTTGKGSGTTMAPPTTLSPKPTAAPTTTTPKGGTPPTTVPTTTGAPSTTVPATAPATPATTPTTDFSQYGPVVEGYIKSVLGDAATPAQAAAIAALYSGSGSGGGSGSSGPSTAQKKASAKIQTQAGKKAQAQYNALAKTAFDQAQADAGAFYNKQTEQANKSIDDATAQYLKSLISPTAYSNVPIAQLTPEQQGLSQNLQAYGATDKMANEQMTQDTGFNQWLANFAKQGTQQMQQADTGYFEALKNAGTGGQAAARLGIAQNVANLQGQSTASAEAIRRQLIQAGIEALIAGQTNAANTLAQ